MKRAVIPVRYRRVLALCVVSLLIHVLILESIARLAAPLMRIDPKRQGTVITARLRPAKPAADSLPPAAVPQPRPRVRSLSEPSTATQAPQPLPAGAPVQADHPQPDPEPLVQMPSHYRVRLPPPVLLSFEMSRSMPGKPAFAAGGATISVVLDGDRYLLRADGVTGPIESEGRVNDAGIQPLNATEQRTDGSTALTRFDRETGRIDFGAGNSLPGHLGAQDRASLLLQLAGIGLAEPDQMHDTIEIYVGSAAGAAIVRFQVIGQEDIASALGTLATWHLTQLVKPGETRLELWLAPAHHWYPVQLRTTAPDGTVSTQLVTKIEGG